MTAFLKNKSNRLSIYILLAMVGGILTGGILNRYFAHHPEINAEKVLDTFSLAGDIFLRLIKMIVAPLVFTTLVTGVAKQGDLGSVGRVGGKTLAWFFAGTFTSLFLGMAMVNLFKPGVNMHLALPPVAATDHASTGMTLREFLYHVVPNSLFDAMAKNEILQVVVFSVVFGAAATTLGEKGRSLLQILDNVAHVILKMTGYIMNLAPLAVYGAMTAVIARQGPSVLASYSRFIVEFYLSLGILLALLLGAAWIFIRRRVFTLMRRIKEPLLIAFTTNSSEAAYPRLMLDLERFGCNEKIVSFVLPLGYSFNLDGSMMYMTFASLFIAQSYGIPMDFSTQVTMLLVLMVTSKGIAGVPRASLVVIAATLATFKLPEAGMGLLLGIDPIMDMGRASMNVAGNSIATVIVDKWESGNP
jgi:Na+/H+-dicarboxylate symporter